MSTTKVIKLPASALEPERTIIYQCPYWDLLPPLSEEEMDALSQSIADDGIKTPLVVLSVMTDVWMVLDGWHRLSLAEQTGLYADDVPIHSIGEDQGYDEEELHDLAVELNLRRRHLTPEARAEWVLKLRREGKSTRQIADTLGVSQSAVARDIKKAGESGDSPQAITGKDGKEYPATQPPKAEPPRQASLLISKPEERTGPSYFEGLLEKKPPTPKTPAKTCARADCIRKAYGDGEFCTEHIPNLKEKKNDEPTSDLPDTGVRGSQVGPEARGDPPVSSALVAHPTGLSSPVVGEAQRAERKDDTAHTPVVAETERPPTQSGSPLVSQGEIALSVDASFAKAGKLCPKHAIPFADCQLMGCPHVRPEKTVGVESSTPSNGNGNGFQHGNTPDWLLALVRQINDIALDPCSNKHSQVNAKINLTIDDDGLSDKWEWAKICKKVEGLCYGNPDYADITPWAERTVAEAALGAEQVWCLPSSHSTAWYKLLRTHCQLLIQLGRKVEFGREGVYGSTAKHETTLFYFGPQAIKVRAIMERAGHQVYNHKEYVAPAKEEKQLGLPLEATPLPGEAIPTPPQTDGEPGPWLSRELAQFAQLSEADYQIEYPKVLARCVTDEEKAAFRQAQEELQKKRKDREVKPENVPAVRTVQLHAALKELGAAWQREGLLVYISLPGQSKNRTVMGALPVLKDRTVRQGAEHANSEARRVVVFWEDTPAPIMTKVCTLSGCESPVQEATPKDKDLYEMEAFLRSGESTLRLQKYNLSEYAVTSVSLTAKQLTAWQKDERIKLRTLDWFASMSADMTAAQTRDAGIQIFDRMTELTVTRAERDKVLALWQERLKVGFGEKFLSPKEEIAMYKKKAPVPKRNKGKTEEPIRGTIKKGRGK